MSFQSSTSMLTVFRSHLFSGIVHIVRVTATVNVDFPCWHHFMLSPGRANLLPSAHTLPLATDENFSVQAPGKANVENGLTLDTELSASSPMTKMTKPPGPQEPSPTPTPPPPPPPPPPS